MLNARSGEPVLRIVDRIEPLAKLAAMKMNGALRCPAPATELT
jgi:hypothetical protein